ncbi:MAG TPA: isocitrate lyase/PEP mutase family protein [Candidatus Methylomirabilis sp.]|nr:isocitrate lyase/PEP mutase family protein [Candidatus Methylomirabilis sp.]
MERHTPRPQALLRDKVFLHMPSVYDAIGGRLVQLLVFEAVYVGGNVTGWASAVTEPLLRMTEQVRLAGDVAQSMAIPLVVDAGAGFGEPLHSMRSVREFIRVGVAGIHIEDQLYPKRAHCHKYVVHGIPVDEFVEKIALACRQREQRDPDFISIARTDTCRALGLDGASLRLDRAAEVGADLGMLFPRTPAEAERAPQRCRLPLVYVQSRGNRDGRPIFSRQELPHMGYVACIEAQVIPSTAFHFLKPALTALRQTGRYTGMTRPGRLRRGRQSRI